MKRLLATIAFLATSALAYETGPANSVYRVPATPAGARPVFGAMDLSSSAAVGNSILGVTNGGTGSNTLVGAPFVRRTGDTMTGALNNATGFVGPLTGAASLNVLKTGDTMTGPLLVGSSTGGLSVALSGVTAFGANHALNSGSSSLPSLRFNTTSTSLAGFGRASDYFAEGAATETALKYSAGNFYIGIASGNIPITIQGTTGLVLVGTTSATSGLALTNPGVTANTVPVFDANRKFASSPITATELGYLTGSTANIQTQINAAVAGSGFVLKTGDTMTGKLETRNNTGIVVGRDLNAGDSTNDVNVVVGNYGTSQGVGILQWFNAAAASTPSIRMSFQPRNNAGSTQLNMGNIEIKKDAGADTATATIYANTTKINSDLGSTNVATFSVGGATVNTKLAVISNLNGGFNVKSNSSSAGVLLERTNSSTGSMYLGADGNRNTGNTYDSFQIRKPNTNTLWDVIAVDGGTNSWALYGATSGAIRFGTPAVSSGTYLYPSAPPAVSGSALVSDTSGNLSWTNISTPTVTTYTSGSNLYTPPVGTKYLEVFVVGSGGGGGNSVAVGLAGATTYVGSVTTLVVTGGAGGAAGGVGAGGQGGVPNSVLGGGFVELKSSAGSDGAPGVIYVVPANSVEYATGGGGGGSCMGGAGAGGDANNANPGKTGKANTGGGGGGAGKGPADATSGSGGGGGGCLEAVVTTPAANYPVVVGAGGAPAGSAGAGAAGRVTFKAY